MPNGKKPAPAAPLAALGVNPSGMPPPKVDQMQVGSQNLFFIQTAPPNEVLLQLGEGVAVAVKTGEPLTSAIVAACGIARRMKKRPLEHAELEVE